jgi:hypothetical protein
MDDPNSSDLVWLRWSSGGFLSPCNDLGGEAHESLLVGVICRRGFRLTLHGFGAPLTPSGQLGKSLDLLPISWRIAVKRALGLDFAAAPCPRLSLCGKGRNTFRRHSGAARPRGTRNPFRSTAPDETWTPGSILRIAPE